MSSLECILAQVQRQTLIHALAELDVRFLVVDALERLGDSLEHAIRKSRTAVLCPPPPGGARPKL